MDERTFALLAQLRAVSSAWDRAAIFVAVSVKFGMSYAVRLGIVYDAMS